MIGKDDNPNLEWVANYMREPVVNLQGSLQTGQGNLGLLDHRGDIYRRDSKIKCEGRFLESQIPDSSVKNPYANGGVDTGRK